MALKNVGNYLLSLLSICFFSPKEIHSNFFVRITDREQFFLAAEKESVVRIGIIRDSLSISISVGGLYMPDKNRIPEEEERKKSKDKWLLGETSTRTEDLVSYAILALGILFLFFSWWIGGSLIGIIFGIYFSGEIIEFARTMQRFVEEQGTVRSLILLGTTIGLFIMNPAFFVAAAIGVGVKQLLRLITHKT